MPKQAQYLYEFGPFRVDAAKRLLHRDGEVVPLASKTFDMLLALIEMAGDVVEKDELMRRVWPDTIVEEVNLAYHISLLRKALGDSRSDRHYIVTIPGQGYRFVAEVRECINGNAAFGSPRVRESFDPQRDEELIDKDESGEQRARVTDSRTLEEAGTGREIAPLSIASQLRRRSGWLWPIVLLPSSLLVVSALIWRPAALSDRERVMSVPRVIPFTSFPGREFQPSFSPDDTQIAFVWSGEQDNNEDIYVKQIGGEGLLRLTTDPASDRSPVWSPDGRSIAFVRDLKERNEIYVVPSLGGPELKLIETLPNPTHRAESTERSLAWSPDGRYLAVVDSDSLQQPRSISLLEPETLEMKRLTSPPVGWVGDTSPVFSPDGKTLAFKRVVEQGKGDIYLIPVSGGDARRLTFEDSFVLNLHWSSEGQKVIYSMARSNETSLWSVSASGGTPERVPFDGRLAQAVSRQGDRHAFVQNSSDHNIYRMELNPEGRGTSPTKLIYSTRGDSNPQVSPDGKRVVFCSNRAGGSGVWLSDSEGANAVLLASFGDLSGGTPRWSPDGRLIAFDWRPEGNSEIFAIKPEGGKARRLTTDPSEEVCPSFSKDGKWIYFGSNRGGSLQIWKISVEGDGPPSQVTKQGGFEGFESPDGHYFYYAKGRNQAGIWRVPVAGGREELVLDVHRAGYWRSWAVVDQGIYFATGERPDRPNIEFFSFATRKVTLVASLDKPLPVMSWGLSASPDGRWLLHTQDDHPGSDIMLEETSR